MSSMNFQMFNLDLEKAEVKLSTLLDHQKSKRTPEKHLFCFIDYTKAFDCVDHNKLGNSERYENTRPPDLPPGKSVCRSRSNS